MCNQAQKITIIAFNDLNCCYYIKKKMQIDAKYIAVHRDYCSSIVKNILKFFTRQLYYITKLYSEIEYKNSLVQLVVCYYDGM